MKKRILGMMIVVGMMVGCAPPPLPKVPMPPVPQITTVEGKANVRECQKNYAQGTSTCNWQSFIPVSHYSGGGKNRTVCENDCTHLLSNCYAVCE
jgi:hypothetical protein